MTFGDKIKAIRLAKDRTQEDIAFELDMTVSSYSKIERDVTDVNLSRIIQISKVFKMSIAEIFNYGEPKSKMEGELEKLRKSNEEKEKLLTKKDKEILEIQRQLISALREKKKK